jgi:hypothetical protein
MGTREQERDGESYPALCVSGLRRAVLSIHKLGDGKAKAFLYSIMIIPDGDYIIPFYLTT